MSKVVAPQDDAASQGSASDMDDLVIVETPVEERNNFAVPIVTMLSSTQMQHGLQNGDYIRYQHYLSRRIVRVRRALKITNKKKKFQQIELESLRITSDQVLVLVLVQAERCWAHAMALKESTAHDSRAKYHIQRRLAKAKKYSSQLLQLTEKHANERTRIEANAYHCWISGTFALEKGMWETAYTNFKNARMIYDQLAKVDKVDTATYVKRIDELDPILRFCQYNLKRSNKKTAKNSQTDNDELMQQFVQDEAIDNSSLLLKPMLDKAIEDSLTNEVEYIVWRGKKIPVTNDKLRVIMKEAHSMLHQATTPHGGGEGGGEDTQQQQLFDKALLLLSDALSLARSLPNGAGGEGVCGSVARDVVVCTLRRNVLLMVGARARLDATNAAGVTNANSKDKYKDGRPATPNDIISLTERILQNLDELKALPDYENDPIDVQAVNCAVVVYKGIRCYYMALVYNGQDKWSEAMALFSRAAEYAADAQALMKGKPTPSFSLVDASEITWLSERARIGTCVPRANALLKQHEMEQSAAALALQTQQQGDNLNLSKALKDILERGAEPTLIDFPPKLSAVPVKPVLFDLAFDSIEFPDLSQRKPQKRFFGLFG